MDLIYKLQVSSCSAMHSTEASELLNSLPHLESVRTCLRQAEVTNIDCSLSSLDSFVIESLQKGQSKPYQSQLAMQVFQPKPIRLVQ